MHYEGKVEVTADRDGKAEQSSDTSESSGSAGTTTVTKTADQVKIASIKQKLVMKSQKAHTILLMSIDKDLIRLFADVSMGDANALWTVMERHFLQANTSAGEVASLTRELSSIKMMQKKNGSLETIHEFVARVKSIVARLETLKESPGQMTVMIQFIQAVAESGLPEYSIACELAWRDIENGTAKTLDDLVKNFIRQRVPMKSFTSAAAAAVSMSIDYQNDSGKLVGDRGWQQGGGRGRGRGNGRFGNGNGRLTRTCYSCGASDHLKKDCPEKKEYRRSYALNARGRGISLMNCPTRTKREANERSAADNEKKRKPMQRTWCRRKRSKERNPVVV